ncbi:MAG: filamentous hemagglutinin N-terminal domain-containing protein, partial [Cyanothece sp. SIO1E1]|nr:filamentous hemagglutinin N-terminal domain-containing protein [Cyanothece sp. SIO1E1]
MVRSDSVLPLAAMLSLTGLIRAEPAQAKAWAPMGTNPDLSPAIDVGSLEITPNISADTLGPPEIFPANYSASPNGSALAPEILPPTATGNLTSSAKDIPGDVAESNRSGLQPEILLASEIIPANDGTGTTVSPNGNQIDIGGGTLSGDGANLFQSFKQFGLDTGEIANFLSTSDIQNILGRIVGGEASVIDGLIQVSGSNANLYLLNPAGIILGEHARLNVPGSFSAITADGIGFDGGWLNAVGENDYSILTGAPEQFTFTAEQPGSVLNQGNLAVGEGKNLTLLGGTVVNTGSLSAPEGIVTIAAVPGESLVRIGQDHMLLSLEVQAAGSNESNNLPFTPLTLPELLTGENTGHATHVVVNPDGTIRLGNADTQIPTAPGTAIVSGTLDVSAPTTGGTVSVLGQQVGLIDADVRASGNSGGGTVLIGGDFKGEGTIPNADVTLIDTDSTIRADALREGDGGQVIVFSEATTRVEGTISARGGANAGNGGLVETSSRSFLEITTTPDVSAPAGLGGTWLIDPRNIIITDEESIGIATTNPFIAINDDAKLNVDLVTAALTDGADVIISTGTTGTQAGDITLATDLDFDGTGNNSLSLEAANNIFIDGQILDRVPGNDSLNLFLNADSDGSGEGRVAVNQAISTGGGTIAITGMTNTANQGISVDAALNSSSGDITLIGTNTLGEGVAINESINSSGGDVTITGISTNAVGINLLNAINSGTGDITLTADAQTLAGSANAQLMGSGELTLQPTTPTLDLEIGGIAAPSTTFLNNSELAVITDGFSSITIGGADSSGGITVTGDVTFSDPVTLQSPTETGSINTTGGSLSTNGDEITFSAADGITVSNLSSAGGDVTLNADIDNQNGGKLTLANATIDTGNGDFIGVGRGNAANPAGVEFNNSTIRTNNGNILLTGTGANGGSGIALVNNSTLATVGTGDITLTGIGAAGIRLENSLINPTSVGSGAVTLTANTINLLGNTQIRGNNRLRLQPLGIANDFTLNVASGANTFQNGFSEILIGRRNSSGLISLNGDITFSDPVTVRSPAGNGSINTAGAILTGTDNATITLDANQNISTGTITNSGQAITLTSTDGNINTSAGFLNSSGSNTGGEITLTTAGNITTGNIAARGNSSGGPITLTSNSGAINTSAGSLDASSTTMGGAIALTALSDITLGADNAGK